MQSPHGLDGQLNACWNHKVTEADIVSMRSAGFLVSVIHGRHDIIAQICHARRLAERLQPFSRMVALPGGHLVSRERTEEVNQALMDLIRVSEMKIGPQNWTNLPKRTSGWFVNTGGENQVSIVYGMLAWIHLMLLFFFGLFVLVFEFIRKAARSFKPARVGPALT